MSAFPFLYAVPSFEVAADEHLPDTVQELRELVREVHSSHEKATRQLAYSVLGAFNQLLPDGPYWNKTFIRVDAQGRVVSHHNMERARELAEEVLGIMDDLAAHLEERTEQMVKLGVHNALNRKKRQQLEARDEIAKKRKAEDELDQLKELAAETGTVFNTGHMKK